jgi:hypothetical protein
MKRANGDDWARFGLTREQGRADLKEREAIAQAVHLHLVTGLPLAQLVPPEYRRDLPRLEARFGARSA